VGRVVTCSLDKETYESLRNYVMMLSLDFMPPNQIVNMSLNDLRRRVATHDKNQTRTQMEKPSIALDLEHRVSASGAPPLSFHRLENHFLEYLRH
jgi:hypothetical protein